MKGKTILWIGVYAVVAYGAYYLYFSKQAYAKKIKDAGMSEGTLEQLKAFDMSYLRDWAKAAKSKQATFTHKGKTYNTKGGKLTK